MITAAQARKIMLDSTSGELMVALDSISAVLQSAAAHGHSWPVTIAVKKYGYRISQLALEHLQTAGWKAKIVCDQRDGDFIQIEEP